MSVGRGRGVLWRAVGERRGWRVGRLVLGAPPPRRWTGARGDRRNVRQDLEAARLHHGAERPLARVPVLDGRPPMTGPVSGALAALPDEQLSVLDLVDRLLNRGVVITGEATISVAGVDLVYLGLNVILTATESIAQKEARTK